MSQAATHNPAPVLPGLYQRDSDGRLVEVEPSVLCPELLTEAEAVRYLRLDETNIKDPGRTLRYYREQGQLKATQVGRPLRYRRIELDNLLARLTDSNPR